MSLCSSLSLSIVSQIFLFLIKNQTLELQWCLRLTCYISIQSLRWCSRLSLCRLVRFWFWVLNCWIFFFIFSFLSWTFKIMLPATRILKPRKTMIGLRWHWIHANPHLIILCSIETELMHWSTMTNPVKIMESRLCIGYFTNTGALFFFGWFILIED